MPTDGYTGVGFRKSHRKSRLGCITCKRRRIKCDETKPECNNCTRHSVPCSYQAASTDHGSRGPSAATPTSSDIGASPSVGSTETDDLRFDWDPVAAELMHHYSTTTCFSLTGDPALQTFYQLEVPKVAFSHTHVLHLLLSLSAIQLSRLRPNRQNFYLEHAERHSQAGFRIASRLLPKINQDNCHSLFLFASLSCYFAILKGPRPGSFLLFDDDRPAEWLALFRGIKTVLELHQEDIEDGVLSPIIRAGKDRTLQGNNVLSSAESAQLGVLRVMISKTSPSDEDSLVLNAAVDYLHLLFSSRVHRDGRNVPLELQSVGVWLYRCTDEFTTLLQNRNPAALAIFAHACVPMNDLSSYWGMKEWIPHLLTGIWERLSQEYRPVIEWPIQQTGWLPPAG